MRACVCKSYLGKNLLLIENCVCGIMVSEEVITYG